MKILHKNYTTIFWLCLATAFLGVRFDNTFLIFISTTTTIYSILSNAKARKINASTFFLSFLCIFFLADIACYITIGSTTESIIFCLYTVSAGAFYILKQYPVSEELAEKKPSSFLNKSSFVLATFLLLATFFILRGSATAGLLTSPWHVVPNTFFVLITLIFFILYYRYKKLADTAGTATLTSLYLYAIWGVCSIVYILGYGFDPQLHIASSLFIFSHGSIDPITPMYLTQYSIVNTVAHLFGLPIVGIVKHLSPIIASTLLPYALYRFLTDKKINPRTAIFTITLLPLFIAKEFIATTPYNLSIIFSLSAICFSKIAEKPEKKLGLFLSLLALFAHPLPGIFAFGTAIYSLVSPHFPKRTTLHIFSFILSSVAIPVLFVLYKTFSGIPFSTLIAYPDISTLMPLFSLPRNYNGNAPPLLDLLYILEKSLPILLIIGTYYGTKKIQEAQSIVFFAVSIFLNGIILALFVRVPELHTFDAAQYSERLVRSGTLFLVPCAWIALSSVIEKTNAKNKSNKLFLIPLTLLLIASVYLTHPQHNAKVIARGFNTTDADMTFVKTVEAEQSKTFAVLSPAPTGAAWVRLFGFHPYIQTASGSFFSFAIPSGSYLGETYNTLMSSGFTKEKINDVFQKTGVETLYIAVPSYWDNSKKRIEELTSMREAELSEHIGERHSLFVARFSRNDILINTQE